MDLNDAIPCTQCPTWTEQACAFDRALDLLPKRLLPSHANMRPNPHFSAWLVQYMDTNDTDAIGNFADLVEYAASHRGWRRAHSGKISRD